MSTNMTPGLSQIKNIIAVASGKGGVGKSTVTVNLAYALKKSGYKVGLMDADLYGPSQPHLLGSTTGPEGRDGFIVPVDRDGIKFISIGVMNPSGKAMIIRSPLAVKAINQFLTGVLWGELDYLLIDLPPGTGDIQLTLAQQARLTGGIIVTTPQNLALQISKKGAEMFQAVSVPILGIVENMSGFTCSHCHEMTPIFKKGGGEKLADELNVPFLGSLPLDPEIMLSGDEGVDLLVTNENSHAAKAFLHLAKNLEVALEAGLANENVLDIENCQISDGNLDIEWKGGGHTQIDAYSLRIQCPCAACIDEHTGNRILDVANVPLTIKALSTKAVGRYGITIQFSDGHGTGIYKLEKLKNLQTKEQENHFSV